MYNILHILSAFSFYLSAGSYVCQLFVVRFLQATDALYTAEGRRLMQELDVPEYLAHVDKRLQEENERVLHYLDGGTR